MNGIVASEEFLTLLTGHQRRLAGYVRALVPQRADADEVLQEVNLYLCRHAADFELGTDFAAWAMRMAHFRVLQWRDRRSRDKLVFDAVLLEHLAVAAQSLDLDVDRRRAALEDCLKQLSSQDYELVHQLFFGEAAMTPARLAESMGRSAKGIYASLNRVRMRLFDCVRRKLAREDHAV